LNTKTRGALVAMTAIRSRVLMCLAPFLLAGSTRILLGQHSSFHNAPGSARQMKNPVAGQAAAIHAGQELYSINCASCHGARAQGSGNIPALTAQAMKRASDGEIFWYITRGDIANGMPSWASLSPAKRWQVVSFLKSSSLGSPADTSTAERHTAGKSEVSTAPPPTPPFTDYRYEKPGKFHHITLHNLPAPYKTASAANGPIIVPRPAGAWPEVPPGFKVEMYATGLHNPRLMRKAPNGDIFLAETSAGDIRVFRGMTVSGKPKMTKIFATGLNTPFGIAFYPPGRNPQWVYISNMDSVVRFPYRNGDMVARGAPEHLLNLPSGGHHRSRDIRFSPDGSRMFVSVGSHENVSDAPSEKDRADILEFNPDGSGKRVYASGIRNPVGLAIDPETGELWCSVNERDGLGNNLVPDYITHVQKGGFYGWPWWYMGGHQDPRLAGDHPELKDKVITPDVLLQPHDASLQMTFYEGKQFPEQYKGDIFAAEHGSWNRQPRAGYEVIRVPLHHTGHANGEYEDFITGFVVDDKSVWGRPVGVTVAQDGSLLVSDDASGSIWRIVYRAK
jgi:glucose/arabinose dehydrogenase/cytochrome c5